MRLVEWENLGVLGSCVNGIAAAIGAFDGLHTGHKQLIERIIRREAYSSAVITFRENPKKILSPSTFTGEVSTLGQRLNLIESMGIDFCVLIDFSGEFSKLPGRQFLTTLVDKGALRFLAVGTDFRCGSRLDTDAEAIRSFCEGRSIGAELLPAVRWAGKPVSSSRIRKAIHEGRLEDAAAMLGRPYELDLGGVRQEAAGRAGIGQGQVRPPRGIYEARLACPGAAEGEPVDANLDAEGLWTLTGAKGSIREKREANYLNGAATHTGLQLIRLKSRE